MSRTTRTLPRWLKQQITEENQYRNGFRDVQWYGHGSHDMMAYDNRSAQQRTEHLTVTYSTDSGNRHRSLYHTCRNSVCVGHKVRMHGWMFDVCAGKMRKSVKRRYHKLCRQANKLIAWNEYVDDFYGDDEDQQLQIAQQEACEGYYDMLDDGIRDDEFPEDRAANNAYSHGYSDGYNAALRDMASMRHQGVA